MRTIAFLSIVQAAALLTLAAGCTSSPAQSKGIYSYPALARPARPGPVKQFADKISQSSFAKSVSKALGGGASKKPVQKDPVSLAEKPKPPDADWYVSLGDLRVQEHDTAGAREMYHKALSMKPHHLGALLGLGRLFDRQGQLERATENYLEATKHHPKAAMAFNDLGLCYARQAQYDQAIEALNRAIELQPDRVLYRNNIATVYVAVGRIDDALVHLTDAHGAAVAHYNVGYLLNKRGKPRQALEQFSLALQADPKLTAAQDWIESLSAQLNGGPRSPFQTVSDPGRPAPGGVEAQGPALAAPQGAERDSAPPVEQPDFGGFESREQPFNQLRDEGDRSEISSQVPVAGAQPESAVEREQAAPAQDAARDVSPPASGDAGGEQEARLEYLPPVPANAAHPSRY